MKYFDRELSHAFNFVGGLVDVSGITLGTGANQRIGKKIHVHSIRAVMTVRMSNAQAMFDAMAKANNMDGAGTTLGLPLHYDLGIDNDGAGPNNPPAPTRHQGPHAIPATPGAEYNNTKTLPFIYLPHGDIGLFHDKWATSMPALTDIVHTVGDTGIGGMWLPNVNGIGRFQHLKKEAWGPLGPIMFPQVSFTPTFSLPGGESFGGLRHVTMAASPWDDMQQIEWYIPVDKTMDLGSANGADTFPGEKYYIGMDYNFVNVGSPVALAGIVRIAFTDE
jgi:hypothetical protein